MLCEIFKEKKIPFTVSYPEILYSQKTLFRALLGALGVKVD